MHMLDKKNLVTNQFYAVVSSSQMCNNKPNSIAHRIVQGMSSSLLVVVHQYTEFSYIHTCMNNINAMHCFEKV